MSAINFGASFVAFSQWQFYFHSMNSTRFAHIARYAKAAPWPFMTGAICLIVTCVLWTISLAFTLLDNLPEAFVFACWGGGWLVVALFAVADAVSRHREYRRIEAMFRRYGYSERILEPLARSRCQRDAAVFAASETGHGEEATAYFASLGYRWYHILPDMMIRNPLAFLKPSFLKSSFLPGKKARAEEEIKAVCETAGRCCRMTSPPADRGENPLWNPTLCECGRERTSSI